MSTNKSALQTEKSLRRLRWLIISRVAIATFLLGIHIFIDFKQTSVHPGIGFPSFYGLILITYIVSFIFIILLKFKKTVRCTLTSR